MRKVFDENIRFIEELNSTNSFAKELLLKENLPEWSIVLTNYQNTGTGQSGNKWESERDQNLLLSIILYPCFLQLSKIFVLNQVISLGILDFIKTYIKDKKVTIKWPNDVYIQDKKVSGILLINNIRQEKLLSTIAGIGININQIVFPKDIPNPISLKLVTNTDYNLADCLNILIERLELYYNILKQEKYDLLYQSYLENMYLYDTEYQFTDYKNHQLIKGKIIGVTKDGLLQIITNNIIQTYDLKEIEY